VLRAAIEAGVTGLIGLAAALYLLRRPRGRPRLSMAASSALALAAGAAVAFILRAPGGVPALRALVPGSALTPAAVAGAAGRWLSLAALLLAGAPLVLGEELLFRATLQRALEDRTRGRPVGRAAAALATAVVAVVATGGALQIAIASHAMASAVRAATGRTSASFLARLALLAGLAVAAVAV
jgi:membrane protease YdiL (CAAX protease family)